jgi:hypothetical protein
MGRLRIKGFAPNQRVWIEQDGKVLCRLFVDKTDGLYLAIPRGNDWLLPGRQ